MSTFGEQSRGVAPPAGIICLPNKKPRNLQGGAAKSLWQLKIRTHTALGEATLEVDSTATHECGQALGH